MQITVITQLTEFHDVDIPVPTLADLLPEQMWLRGPSEAFPGQLELILNLTTDQLIQAARFLYAAGFSEDDPEAVEDIQTEADAIHELECHTFSMLDLKPDEGEWEFLYFTHHISTTKELQEWKDKMGTALLGPHYHGTTDA